MHALSGYGVTTDVETKATARIMMVSLIPFLVLQVAKMLSSSSGIRVVILVSLLIAFAFLVIYCIYQVTKKKLKKSTESASQMIRYMQVQFILCMKRGNNKLRI